MSGWILPGKQNGPTSIVIDSANFRNSPTAAVSKWYIWIIYIYTYIYICLEPGSTPAWLDWILPGNQNDVRINHDKRVPSPNVDNIGMKYEQMWSTPENGPYSFYISSNSPIVATFLESLDNRPKLDDSTIYEHEPSLEDAKMGDSRPYYLTWFNPGSKSKTPKDPLTFENGTQ